MLWGHLAKLYQFFDDFASHRALATAAALFRLMGGLKQAHGAVFALRYGKICDKSHLISSSRANSEIMAMTTDDKTRTELEAAVFRRLVEHLRSRTDVQNIDLMNLAGFCRNCLSNWLKEAADANGTAMTKDESREAVYGMPYETWKATHQGAASPEQLAAMKKSSGGH
jgi:hypothetical protein